MTKGERDDEEDVAAEVLLLEEVAVGGGMGRTETSCIERESTTTTLLEEGKARRPEGWQSADPPLFLLGGPGSMQSQDSCGGRAMAFGTAAAASFSYCFVFSIFITISEFGPCSSEKGLNFSRGNGPLLLVLASIWVFFFLTLFSCRSV